MKITLDKYTGARRAALIELGRAYASDALQTIADSFINALSLHAAKLPDVGYADEDNERLVALNTLSKAESAARPTIARDRTAARTTARAEVKAAKQLRLNARTKIEAALNAAQDDLSVDQIAPYEATLAQTSSAGADVPKLKLQLLSLADTIDLSTLKAKIKARGGADLPAKLRAQAAALDAAHAAAQVRTGTPEQTATLDLIDGLMIEQLRAIRRLARRAATHHGDPSIADAFSLAALD